MWIRDFFPFRALSNIFLSSNSKSDWYWIATLLFCDIPKYLSVPFPVVQNLLWLKLYFYQMVQLLPKSIQLQKIFYSFVWSTLCILYLFIQKQVEVVRKGDRMSESLPTYKTHNALQPANYWEPGYCMFVTQLHYWYAWTLRCLKK